MVNPLTGERTTNKLTIVPRLVETKNMVIDFASGKYYTVRAIDDDGNHVDAGEFIDIYIHGVHYLSKTDKNGYARVKINLNPGTYSVRVEYKLTKVTNKLVVKQTLKMSKKTIKVKKGKNLVLKAQLKWSNGKPIRGKVIKFKVKGKTFKAKTNSKGIAKVTIKPKFTKTFKKGKTSFSVKYLTNIVKGKMKIQ